MTNRKRVRVMVNTQAKNAYENAVREQYGCVNGKAGHVLEEELRTLFGEGPLAQIHDEVSSLLEYLGLPTRDPVTDREGPQSGETERVGYRIEETLLQRVRSFANNDETRDVGEFVAAIMWHYATEGGIRGQILDNLQTARDYIGCEIDGDEQDDETDEIGKIAEIIVNNNGGEDMSSFTVDDFLDATEIVCGSRSKHMIETRLDDVADRLGMDWLPSNPDVFVDPTERDIPDVRDPRPLPSARVDQSDRILAVHVLGYEQAVTGNGVAKLTTADITGGVESVANVNVNEIMQAAADEPGYEFDPKDRSAGGKVLKVNARTVQHGDVLRIVDADEQPPEESEHEWIDQALELLEDLPEKALTEIVITNKIARAKYPDEIDEDKDAISDEAAERVTDDEIQQVQEKLGLVDDTEDEEDADEIKTEVESEFDALENAAVATDGGRPIDE